VILASLGTIINIASLAFLIFGYEFGIARGFSCRRFCAEHSVSTSPKAPDSNLHCSFKVFSVLIRLRQNGLEEIDEAGVDDAEASSFIDVDVNELPIGSFD